MKTEKQVKRVDNIPFSEFVPVNSSRIKFAHHDGEHTMTLIFNNMRVYRYIVSYRIYEGLVQAESPGRYFQSEIYAKAQYFFREIVEEGTIKENPLP